MTSPSDPQPSIGVTGLRKTFGSTPALDDVTFRLEGPQVVALLGENGAGKTTLANVLFGLYRADEGHVLLNRAEIDARSPLEALAAGVGMVHQHFNLVDALDAAENILLGLPSGLRNREASTRIRALAARYGLDVSFDRPVADMPIGMQQRVEILKALYRDVSILILDEPTSVLAPTEVDGFLDAVAEMRRAGKIVIFVTHKLDEILRVTDRVLVMRGGRLVADRTTEGATRASLTASMMRTPPSSARIETLETPDMLGGPILEINDLTVDDARGVRAVRDLSLIVRAGEILGLAGVDGNGQRELSDCLAGLLPAVQGRIRLDGEDISARDVAWRRDAGIGFVPEDRHATGLILTLDVAENLAFRRIGHRPNARRGWLDRAAIQQHAEKMAESFDIRPRDVRTRAALLSGGNQQKVVLAREIGIARRLLVVVQPTKGLDVGAIRSVQERIAEVAGRGAGVLYVSTELEHILAIAHRIAVLSSGRIVGELPRAKATAERIGLLMIGQTEDAA